MLLLHDERLLALIDAWLTGVPADAFTNVLPLLRRTFSAYEPGVRRSLGELVGRGPRARGSVTAAGSGIPGFAAGLDTARADAVLPVVRLLLGRDPAGGGDPAGDDGPAEGGDPAGGDGPAEGDGPAGGDGPARGDDSVRDDDLVMDGEPARDDDLVRHGELVRDDDLVGVET